MKNIFKNYYKKIIQRDFINKFSYIYVNQIPQLKKIILNLGCKNSNIKIIASALFSLELIATKPGFIVKSKRSNILLKIRKGTPIGCAVVLEKKQMYEFVFRLLSEVFPSLKSVSGFNSISNDKTNFSFTLKDLVNFKELEKQFYLFIKLPPLNITLITNAKSRKELLYLLHSFKLV